MDKLYFLGAGTPTPNPDRFGTSQVLKIGDEYLMFDCGPATTHKLVKAGLWPTQINYLFFTHYHYDHNADYPCFMLCRWNLGHGKADPIQVFGPPPLECMTEKLFGDDGVFFNDWNARIQAPAAQNYHVNEGGELPRPEPDHDVHNINPGFVKTEAQWTLTTTEVVHAQPWLQSIAYRVETKKGTIVFGGDTGFDPNLTAFSEGADVLVAMCWDHQDRMDDNGENIGVLGTTNVGKIAQEAGVKKLILTHAGVWSLDPDSRKKALEDVASMYSGEIVFADELMEVDLW